jgi:hypothetical protein
VTQREALLRKVRAEQREWVRQNEAAVVIQRHTRGVIRMLAVTGCCIYRTYFDQTQRGGNTGWRLWPIGSKYGWSDCASCSLRKRNVFARLSGPCCSDRLPPQRVFNDTSEADSVSLSSLILAVVDYDCVECRAKEVQAYVGSIPQG